MMLGYGEGYVNGMTCARVVTRLVDARDGWRW